MPESARVNPEWAVWGKREDQPNYLVLAHSNRVVRGPDFDFVLGRYSPGTLQPSELPQVVINWFESKASDQYYIGLAIYRETEHGELDFSGRDITVASYYCVPYLDLAQASGSYLTMYEQISRIEHPISRSPSSFLDLAAPPLATVADEPQTRLAMRAAALLLTNTPVCVLGAGEVGLTERLRFLETTASFLPYGMRAKLSAATWTSATSRQHQLRLFFAGADRQTGDHVVIWGRVDNAPIDDDLASAYLSRLHDGALSRALLAQQIFPAGFTPTDVRQTLRRLGMTDDAPQPSWPDHLAGDDSAPANALPPDDAPKTQPGDTEPDDVLASCGCALKTSDARTLRLATDKLHSWRDVTSQTRWLMRDRIEKHGLFAPGSIMAAEQLRPFYAELLRLAFAERGKALSYRDVRDVLQCTGYSIRQHMPVPLARAMMDVGVEGPARLLLMSCLDDGHFRFAVRTYSLPPDEIASAMADSSLDEADQEAVRYAALRYLSQKYVPTASDRQAFLAAMLDHDLVSVLQQQNADHPEYLFKALTIVLRFVSRGRLTRATVSQVFERMTVTPSVPLLVAVLPMVTPNDASAVVQDYLRTSIRDWDVTGDAQAVAEQAVAVLSSSPIAATTKRGLGRWPR